MKLTVAALMLTAAIATPVMAQTYMQSNQMANGRMVQTQPRIGSNMGTDAYAYVPAPGWNSAEINGAAFAMDPDPSVRHQLQIQSDVSDR